MAVYLVQPLTVQVAAVLTAEVEFTVFVSLFPQPDLVQVRVPVQLDVPLQA